MKNVTDMPTRTFPGARALALGVLVAAAVSACVDVRSRPSDPTGPDETTGAPPIVRIIHPSEGQELLRTSFTQEPGVRVSLAGENLQAAEELILLAFSDEFPNTPFFAAQGTLEDGRIPEGVRILVAPTTLQGASEVEILVRAFRDNRNVVISTDSVGVVLR